MVFVMKKVLTIAGSDCSGGAGIQADIKTMTIHKVYAMSVITALTAQNTVGIAGILDTPADFLGKQLDCVFSDIMPDAVKIGMVSTFENILCIADRLKKYQAKNIVADPVMVSTSGKKLLSNTAFTALKENLFPLAELITPNLPEAEALSGMTINSKPDMEKAAKAIRSSFGCNVLIKGGHSVCDADDLLCMDEMIWFHAERIENINTHGTGCTLSSAIASNLANGLSLIQSVEKAKEYILGAIRDKMALGAGAGPLNHMYGINPGH